MSYSSGNRMPKTYEGKEYYYSQTKIAKKDRKTDSIKLEDLMDAYRKTDDEFEPQEPEYIAKERLIDVLGDIRNGTYKPDKPRIQEKPKSSGGTRTLTIPHILDRVVGKTVLAKLTPIVDPKFDPRSHGGRPGKGIQSAIAEAYEAIEGGMHYVLAVDIKDAFPNTPTESALAVLERLSEQHPCMGLAKVCIRGHIGAKRKVGLDQGHPLSPIAFNAFMGEWVDSLVPLDADIRYIRYLDNIYLFGNGPKKLNTIMESVQTGLTAKGFILKTDPCRELNSEKLPILGYQIGLNGSRIEITGDEAWVNDLAESLIRAYEKPNSHKLGKPIVDSWLKSQALRTSWNLEDTQKVNELLEYYGFQYKVNHEDAIKDLQDKKLSWIQKYNLHNIT